MQADYSIQQIRQKRRQRSIHNNHQKLAKNPYKNSKKNVSDKGLHAPFNDTLSATYRRDLACLESQLIARNKKGVYYHKRLDTLRATQKNGELVTRAVSISNDVRWFAQQYDIALNELIGGCMNPYKYQLHTEFVEQLTEAEQLKPMYDQAQEYSFFLDAVGYSAALGIEANNHHDVITATHWADILEKSLDIAKSIGEGICGGLYDTAMFGVHAVSCVVDKAAHPLDSFAALGRGMESIVSWFAQGVDTAIQFKGLNKPAYRINFEKESQQLLDQMSAVIAHCYDKIAKMSARERVRCVTILAQNFLHQHCFLKQQKYCACV